MHLAEHQMRSLTVCTVTMDVPKWVSSERTRSKREKLAGLFGSKNVAKAEAYLLILTCDRLAVLRADPPGAERDDLVERNSGSNATSSSSLLDTNPPFVSLPLTLVQDVYAEGSSLIVEHYLAGNPSLSPATSSGGVDEEDRSVHFPFFSAIGRMIKGDKNNEGVLRLGTDSETVSIQL